jgi:hypothetical protein
MIATLVGWGMSERIAKIVAYVGIPLLILLAFYLALDAYGDSRYREGKKDADAAWVAASDKLIKQAQSAGTKADTAAAARQADFAAKQEDEKDRIDAAKADGSSPMDVLFGAGS